MKINTIRILNIGLIIAIRYYLTFQALEAVSTPETSANIYHTTRRNYPEDRHILVYCHDNLQSHTILQ